MNQEALQKMLTGVLTEVNAPVLAAVREALDLVARLEERVAYAERIARLETRLEQVERLEDRIRDLERRVSG